MGGVRGAGMQRSNRRLPAPEGPSGLPPFPPASGSKMRADTICSLRWQKRKLSTEQSVPREQEVRRGRRGGFAGGRPAPAAPRALPQRPRGMQALARTMRMDPRAPPQLPARPPPACAPLCAVCEELRSGAGHLHGLQQGRRRHGPHHGALAAFAAPLHWLERGGGRGERERGRVCACSGAGSSGVGSGGVGSGGANSSGVGSGALEQPRQQRATCPRMPGRGLGRVLAQGLTPAALPPSRSSTPPNTRAWRCASCARWAASR